MKRPFAIFLVFASVLLLFTGTALAGTAPSAMSYFTNPGYNKTYTGEDSLNHTMTVIWVGETWNKLGAVIYSINYEDVYQRDGNTYIDVMSATEIFENARPSYPDSPKHSVYQVKWYADGSKEVISDYRPAEPEQTPPPAQTEQPEATPTPTTPSPAPATPSAKPTTPSPKPTSTPSAATTKPSESSTPKPTPESSVTPPNLPASDSPTPSEGTSAVTSSATPAVTEVEGNTTGVSITPSPSGSTPEDEPELPSQGTDASRSRWIWPVIILSGLGAAILLAYYLEGRRRKEEKDNEDHEA